MLSLKSFLRKGVCVEGLCWEHLKSKGSLSCITPKEFDVRGATMWVQYKAPKHQGYFLGSSSSFAAIRKEAGLFCVSFLRKGGVFASGGLCQNIKRREAVVRASQGEASHLSEFRENLKAERQLEPARVDIVP